MSRFGKLLMALLAFTVLIPGVAAAQSDSMQSNSGSMQMDGSEMQQMNDALADLRAAPAGKEFEIEYVNQIIPHHQGALQMAQAVVDRAPNQEVRDAAAKIIKDQKKEIEDLTTFLQDKYGQQVKPDQRMAMDSSMMDQMSNADPATAEKMFLLGMREHHEIAIQMGNIALEKANSDTILSQARNMVSSQRAEQDEFAGYLKQFYGIDAPEPTGDMQQAMQPAMQGSDMQMPETGGPSLPTVAVLTAVVLAVVAFGAYALRRALG